MPEACFAGVREIRGRNGRFVSGKRRLRGMPPACANCAGGRLRKRSVRRCRTMPSETVTPVARLGADAVHGRRGATVRLDPDGWSMFVTSVVICRSVSQSSAGAYAVHENTRTAASKGAPVRSAVRVKPNHARPRRSGEFSDIELSEIMCGTSVRKGGGADPAPARSAEQAAGSAPRSVQWSYLPRPARNRAGFANYPSLSCITLPSREMPPGAPSPFRELHPRNPRPAARPTDRTGSRCPGGESATGRSVSAGRSRGGRIRRWPARGRGRCRR